MKTLGRGYYAFTTNRIFVLFYYTNGGTTINGDSYVYADDDNLQLNNFLVSLN